MGRRLRRLLAAIPAAFAPVAVAESQSSRDSAGIEIVENRAAGLAATRAWRIDRTPIVTIGGLHADGDTLNEMLLVMGITRLSDGRWAVGVQASHAVRFYDARGRFVGSAGRKGQGPGEFQQIMGVWALRGDTVAVLDLGEIELFTKEGSFVRQGASRARGDRFVYPEVPLGHDAYLGVMRNDGRSVPPAGRRRNSHPLVRVSLDGATIDTIGAYESAEEIFDGRQPWGTQVAFSAWPAMAGSGERFFVSSTSKPEVSEFAIDGRLRRIIRLPDRGLKPGDEAIQAHRSWIMNMPGEDGRPMAPAMKARMMQSLERTVYAERFPPFGKVIADKSGNLWVQQYDYRSTFYTPGPVRTQTMAVATKWYVIDPRGRWVTTVDLPARFTPVEIGADYVAGLARDEDEIEQVRVYRLLKPQSP